MTTVLTPGKLSLAAWLCVSSAVLQVPTIGLELFLAANSLNDGAMNYAVHAAGALLGIVASAFCAAMFTILRVFLEEKHGFYKASQPIRVVVYIELLVMFLSSTSLIFPEFAANGWLGLILYYCACIARTVAAIKMLGLAQTASQGLLRAMCIAEIVFGVCCATVILLPVGILATMVSDVLLAIVFFNAAD
jgi:hypothetical protein